MKNDQKGISISLVVAIIAVIALVCAVGYIWCLKKTDWQIGQPVPEGGVHDQLPTENTANDKKTKTDPTAVADGQPKIVPSTGETAGWQTYRDAKCGYEIKYPQNYQPTRAENGTVSFVSSDTSKCHAAGGPTETMCDEMNGGPWIGCVKAAELLKGFSSLEEYVGGLIKDGTASKNFPVRKTIIGGNQAFEVEGLGMAGAYREIYLRSGDNVISFNIAKEGNENGVKILDQMFATFKFIN